MDKFLSNQLRKVESISEKAALIADFLLNDLPAKLALVTRRCVLLHWFDISLVEALLQDVPHDSEEVAMLYSQISSLSFVEISPMGFAIQNVTRTGLLKLYEQTQPELLRNAAQLAAPVYAAHHMNTRFTTEAFFCYRTAGNQEESIPLFIRLLTQAITYEDWPFADNLLALNAETEQLSFVTPLLLSPEQTFLCDLARGMHVGQKIDVSHQQSTSAWKQAIKQTSLGTRQAVQHHLTEARTCYQKALQRIPTLLQARIAYGITLAALHEYEAAAAAYSLATYILPDNAFLLQQQGAALLADMRYEEAILVYRNILAFENDNTAAYTGQGQALFELKRYEEALTSFEYSTFLEPRNPEAFQGKGQCLYELKQYSEAQRNFDIVSDLTSSSSPPKKQSATTIAIQSERKSLKATQKRRKPVKVSHPFQVQTISFVKSSFVFVGFLVLIALFSLPFLLIHRTAGGPGSIIPKNTPINSPTATPFVTPSTSDLVRLSNPYRFTLSVNYDDLLANNTSEINDVKQQLRSNTLFNNRQVAVAIVYGSAPTDNDISQALQISQKLYTILHDLGTKGEIFQKSAFYKPLCLLGPDANLVTIDVYMYQASSLQLNSKYQSIIVTIDVSGLLNNSLTAINGLKQKIRSQTILQQHTVALALVYGGAITDNDIGQALNISQNVYSVLQQLGQEKFAFEHATYYNALFNLASSTDSVQIDFFVIEGK